MASLVGSPWTVARIVIGDVSPGANSSSRATAASRLSSPGGRVDAFGIPWLRRRNGVPAKSRKASVGMRKTKGRAITAWATRSQRETRGARSRRRARPMAPPDRGEQAADAQRIDPRPEHAQDRRQERQRVEDRRGDDERTADPERAQGSRLEQRASPDSPIATASPEKATALPAVATVDLDRLADRPAAAELLAEAADHEQRVVDREGEAEHRRDVLDVDRAARSPGRRRRGRRASSGSSGRRRAAAGRRRRSRRRPPAGSAARTAPEMVSAWSSSFSDWSAWSSVNGPKPASRNVKPAAGRTGLAAGPSRRPTPRR